VAQIRPNGRNPRKHSRAQIRALANSIKTFGFNAPILVDQHKQVVAGHGRLEAAKLLNLQAVPTITLNDLTDAQATAYMLADNKLTDRSSWDEPLLAAHLQELSRLSLDFDITATGFEIPEIDLRILSLDDEATDTADDFEVVKGLPVSRLGDIWHLGGHIIRCGSSLEPESFDAFPTRVRAAAVFADPPYNVPINGHVSGRGKNKHREFLQAFGEMTKEGFTDFLTKAIARSKERSIDGAVHFWCMDFRHMGEMLAAQINTKMDLLNLCVWAKTNGGMGTFYRSQHELIFVFRNGQTPHRNNVQLGRFGRNRTNVWHYPGANVRSSGDSLQYHPTPKPIALVADALLDCTASGDHVLDPFLGSGTTLLAAHRTGRKCLGVELDPIYVDTAICRWQKMTGHTARLSGGQTFAEAKVERSAG
jgi:DNA modification methylase